MDKRIPAGGGVRGRIAKGAGIAILAVLALVLPVLSAGASTQPQLVDQTGGHFTFTSLRGTPLVVTFVAAHCTDACPLINAEFSQAAQRFAHDRSNVKLLTITLDPEHDPAAVMRDLARRFDANSKQWLFVTGSVPDVHRVMAAFGVVAEQGRRGYAEMHTTFVYFIDKRGNLRKTILASTALSTQIVDEAHRQFAGIASR